MRRRLGHGRAALAGWVIVVVVCGWWAVFRTPVSADLTAFMPRGESRAQRVLFGELRGGGPASRIILAALGGADPPRLASASRALARRLRESGRFVQVANGAAPAEGADLEVVFEHRYLLSPTVTPERFTAEGLRRALERRLAELVAPAPIVEKRRFPADPTAELRSILPAWEQPRQGPAERGGVWFSPDGVRAVLLLQTRAPGFSLDEQARGLRLIRETLDDVVGDAPIELTLSGAPVFAVTSRDVIRGEARRLAAAATVAAALVLFAAYRSPRLLLLGALPLATGMVVATAVVSAFFGGIHGIAMAFGATLIGVAIDYPIHLFSHLGAGGRTRETLQRIWPTLRLGALTTMLGYLAMMGSDFPGLTQLATFAVAGLAAAAATTRFVVPALIPPEYAASTPRVRGPAWGRLPRPGRGTAAATLLAGAAALAFVALRQSQPWAGDVRAMSPIPNRVIAEHRELREALRAPDVGHLLLITAPGAGDVLETSEALVPRLEDFVADGVIGGFDMAAHHLPSPRTQRRRQAALPVAETLARNLDEALEGLPFKRGLFAPFLADVAAARRSDPLEAGDLEGTLVGLKVGSMLIGGDEGWTGFVTLSGVERPAELARRVDALDAPGVQYVNVRAETDHLLAEFRDNALVRLAIGAGIIAAVLWIGVGSARRALRVLVPGAVAIVIDVALLLALGERLSIFHLVSLLLVLGIGVDYGLFFSRPDEGEKVRRRTLHGIAVCAVSTVAVFGILATSAIPVLEAIGLTVALGVAGSCLAAWALAQPAGGSST